jgi:hypothetical protein
MDRNFYIMNEDGTVRVEPDSLAWGRWFETTHRRIAETKLTGCTAGEEIWISTEFMGIDHRFGDGPPLLFETKVFGGDFGEEHHGTREEAVAGHLAMCERVARSLFGMPE